MKDKEKILKWAMVIGGAIVSAIFNEISEKRRIDAAVEKELKKRETAND